MLAPDLLASRGHTLQVTARLEGDRLLGPRLAVVNPPLWELGHVGWFQEHWCLRWKGDGTLADSILPGADALYDSSNVAHDTRWGLPLPTLPATKAYLANVLDKVQERIRREPENESLRYFVRLCTLHEDMHAEAFHYTHQTLGYGNPLSFSQISFPGKKEIEIKSNTFSLGADRDRKEFVFDNEKWAHEVEVAPFRIASSPVTNAEFLAYVEDGGAAPRYWSRVDGVWLERRFDALQPLNPVAPVRHVDWNEAQAWCRWAGRRLPSEAEWTFASLKEKSFSWGSVWEWTSSTFEPFPGFSPDPYRDYSLPWFGTHKVLKGASFATPPRVRSAKFRNFYTADRGDVFAGFRSCAL